MKRRLLPLLFTVCMAVAMLIVGVSAYEVNEDLYTIYQRETENSTNPIKNKNIIDGSVYQIQFQYNSWVIRIDCKLVDALYLNYQYVLDYYGYTDSDPSHANANFKFEKVGKGTWGDLYTIRSEKYPQFYLGADAHSVYLSGTPVTFYIDDSEHFLVANEASNYKKKYYIYTTGDSACAFRATESVWCSDRDNPKRINLARMYENVAIRNVSTYLYDGQVHLPEAPIGTDGSVYYSMNNTDWYTAENATAENGFPVAVGEYTVRIKITDVFDNTINAPVTVKIVNSPAVSAPPVTKDLSFDIDAQELVEAGVALGGDLYYRLGTTGTWSTEIPKAANAGDYTVYYKVVGTGAYAGTESATYSVNVTINKRVLGSEGNWPRKAYQQGDVTYNGTEQSLAVEALENFDPRFMRVVNATHTDAGRYPISFELIYPEDTQWWNGTTDPIDQNITSSMNFKDWYFHWKISKAPVTVTGLTAVDREYDGTRDVELTGTPVLGGIFERDSGKIVLPESVQGYLTYNQYDAGNDKDVNLSMYNTLIDTRTGELSQNYYVSNPVATVNILPAAPTLNTAPAAVAELTYTGSSQALVSAGSATNGTMQYSLNGETWSTSVPKGTDAGLYTVYYRIKGTEPNYKTTEPVSVDVTIAPKAVTVTIEPKTSVYGQAIVELTATDAGILPGDTGVYTLRTDATPASNVGSYDIIGTGTSDNYTVTFVGETDAYTVTPKAITVTIEPKTSVYGQAIVGLTATDDGILPGDTGVYTLRTDATPASNVGSYDIIGTDTSDNYTVTFAGEIDAYTVTPAAQPATVTMEDWTYGGTVTEPQISGVCEDGAVTYRYKVKDAADSTYTAEKPTDAGDYTVAATVAATTNYKETVVTGDFTIAQKTLTVIGLTAVPRNYDSTKDITLTGGALNGIVPGDEGKVTATMPTEGTVATADAGSNKPVTFAVITLSGDKAKNYTLTQPTVTVNIGKADSALTAAPAVKEGLVYSGSAQALVNAGTAEGGEMRYRLGESGAWTADIPTATDHDTYTVYYKAVGDDNHNDTEPASVSVTIAQKAVAEPTVKGSYTYNGSLQTPQLNGFDSTYMRMTGDTQKDAGPYTATITLDNNHRWADDADGKVEWSIAPKAVTVTIESKTSVYGQAIVELTATDDGIVSGDTGVYTLRTDATSASDVGSYDIIGTDTSDNYTVTFAGETDAYTITPATRDDAAVGMEGWTYGETANDPAVTGNAENGAVTYRYKVKDAADSTYTAEKPTDAGNYTVEATIAATTNYKETVVTSDFTIEKAVVTVKVKDKTAYLRAAVPVLGEKDYTVQGLLGSDELKVKPVLSYESEPDMTQKGTVVILASGADAGSNYEIRYVNGTLTIKSRPSSGIALPDEPEKSETATVTPETPEEGGTVTVSPETPEKGSTVTVTPKPEEGYAVDEVIVTDKDGNRIEATDNGDGTYTYTQPAGNVTVKVTFKKSTVAPFPFTDVPTDAYYYEAVRWAVEKGIVVGTTATTFTPDGKITRAQIVTILWRAAGSPEPAESANAFTDVPADAYYAKAVQWAVESGITVGTTKTTFSPDAVCTRAQMVTFMYRALKGTAAESGNFTDVAENAYYFDAVNWAAAAELTVGTTKTTFSPDSECTRAQLVTFLYRAVNKR